MASSRGYEDLVAWQKAIDLAEAVYRLVVLLPKDERFEMSSQLRRGVVSIGANIAEGEGRNSLSEFLHFLGISLGSLAEVDTLLVIGVRVGLLPAAEVNRVRDRVTEERRILIGLSESLRRRLDDRRNGSKPRDSA